MYVQRYLPITKFEQTICESHARILTFFSFFIASFVYMTSWTNVTQIQQEIITYGPVTALMYVYENFVAYKRGKSSVRFRRQRRERKHG